MAFHSIALSLDAFWESSERAIFFCALVLYIPIMPHVNKVFSSTPMQFLGDINFGIYSFHWPVFCSIGMRVILCFSRKKGLWFPVIIGCISALLTTLILAYLYHITCERLSEKVIKTLSAKFYRNQSHDLFLPDQQIAKFLTAGGPTGAGAVSISIITSTPHTTQAMSDAPPEL